MLPLTSHPYDDGNYTRVNQFGKSRKAIVLHYGHVVYAFFFYGFVGWVIDSGYRSLVDRRWTRGGFSFLPFTPSYGLAGVILLWIGPSIIVWPYWIQWVFLGFLFAMYEYVCGHIAVFIHKRRLWDYSGGFLNLHGHTDLLHAVYWATLSLVVLHWVHPWLIRLVSL